MYATLLSTENSSVPLEVINMRGGCRPIGSISLKTLKAHKHGRAYIKWRQQTCCHFTKKTEISVFQFFSCDKEDNSLA